MRIILKMAKRDGSTSIASYECSTNFILERNSFLNESIPESCKQPLRVTKCLTCSPSQVVADGLAPTPAEHVLVEESFLIVVSVDKENRVLDTGQQFFRNKYLRSFRVNTANQPVGRKRLTYNSLAHEKKKQQQQPTTTYIEYFYLHDSLFQALSLWRRSKKPTGDERALGEIPISYDAAQIRRACVSPDSQFALTKSPIAPQKKF